MATPLNRGGLTPKSERTTHKENPGTVPALFQRAHGYFPIQSNPHLDHFRKDWIQMVFGACRGVFESGWAQAIR
jgi:hypothetical protein